MKTTLKQFELFKKWCRYYVKKFPVNGWRVDFFLKDIEGAQAQVINDYLGCVIRVNFCTEITKDPCETWSKLIKDTAKHEMIHVLVANLAELAASRYVTSDEIEKAQEELVVKLEEIIQ